MTEDKKKILARYVDWLLDRSTPEAPVWNIEQMRGDKKTCWNYVDGCMIHSILQLYHLKKDKRYLNFADAFIDFFVQEDGQIWSYDPEEYNLDNINAGKTLFDLYRLTGKEKYRKAIDLVYFQLEKQPRTKEGSFWHKKIYPNQVWCDGLYMAQPFYCLYEIYFNDCKHCDDIYKQFMNVYQYMRNPENGLYFHAYDSSRGAFWCDPVTGLSNNVWLRALGWFAMALVDTCEIMAEREELNVYREGLGKIYRELIDSMIKYQDKESGMWYQIPNFGRIDPNYLETSGSAIFAYAILKSVRLGILSKDYEMYGIKAFEGVCENKLSEKDGDLQLEGICLVAGLGNVDHREGTFDYYMKEPIVKNDAKGVAPLILAYVEMLYRYPDEREGL